MPNAIANYSRDAVLDGHRERIYMLMDEVITALGHDINAMPDWPPIEVERG